ncbi:type II secretion system F family protein [Streptomyces sp. NPDC005373]|uniref:type II secretion system F family protein n=1 Tax=Streptomyces sp. NPDC005373 TaxID=3156879 RepID=UPI0033A5BD56
MSSDQWNLLAAACGALLVGGLLLLARGWRRVAIQHSPTRPTNKWTIRIQRARADLPEAWRRRYRLITLVALVAMVGAWLYTARPVHGLLAAAAVLGLPWIWNPAGTSERQVVRQEAIAEWMQQLAGVHEAGGTLDSAITTSAARSPLPIRPQVQLLAARLRVGATPSTAYRQFADAFADGAVDNAVMLFLTHAQDHGPGLSRALQSMARLTEQEAINLRTVDAERNKVRTSTRWVSIVSIVLALYVVTNASWGQVYRTATGQVMLLVFGCLFGAALLWLRKLAITPAAPRLLNALPQQITAATGASVPAGPSEGRGGLSGRAKKGAVL